ncbi:hypothetical protein MMC26_000931 [Xylographa opegraphella]|nr:hypothetical protein [Xylographa opegraphella]
MYAPKHPPGSNLKGGGFRGGPRRWTGAGPRPARHIPWPEIFKHHISVLEGHLKMIDMIRKHTVPDTGNWRTIVPMVERSQEILRMAKDATRKFVPPSHERDKVPIGSSSASMYPGYSPADHEYGKAAQEFGQQWSAARTQGIEFQPAPDGPQYNFAQSKGMKRRSLSKIGAAKVASGEGSGSGSGSGSDVAPQPAATNGARPPKQTEDTKSDGNEKEEANPYFVIDTNPTPVNLPGVSHKPLKRAPSAEALVEPAGGKLKKAKTNHDGAIPTGSEKRVEFEDISEEVDARMKEKEEKRKRKAEKKRKRESGESIGIAAMAESEKPKKKKSKKMEGETEVGETVPKKRSGSEGEEPLGEGGSKKVKKSKKHKEKTGDS